MASWSRSFNVAFGVLLFFQAMSEVFPPFLERAAENCRIWRYILLRQSILWRHCFAAFGAL